MFKIALFAVAMLLVFALFMALPTIRIDVGTVVASNAFAYIRAALYFIPVGTCVNILSIILGLWVFRVIIALAKVIWATIPIKP